MTLVILAAGMGSRYGGLKQIDPVGKNGEFIIDFSVYDAIGAGFDKVVFVIKKENYDTFKDTIGKRFENKINVEYVFQSLDDLPEGFTVPQGRVKPWGTSHAMLAARHLVKEPFAVINSDDFYGRTAFLRLAEHFSSGKRTRKPRYCMIGYEVENTLTENGSVSRGVCTLSRDNKLTGIVERKKISIKDGVIFYELDGSEYVISPKTTVSMNCWGFTPDVFDHVYNGFKKFLEKHGNEIDSEYYLPFAVEEMISTKICDVFVYRTDDLWYGVTYKEDKEYVKDGISKLVSNGVYPSMLN